MLPLRFSRQAWLDSESLHANVQIPPEEVSHEIHEVALCQQETDRLTWMALKDEQAQQAVKSWWKADECCYCDCSSPPCLWLWLRFQRHVVGHYPIGLGKQAALRGHALYSDRSHFIGQLCISSSSQILPCLCTIVHQAKKACLRHASCLAKGHSLLPKTVHSIGSIVWYRKHSVQ